MLWSSSHLFLGLLLRLAHMVLEVSVAVGNVSPAQSVAVGGLSTRDIALGVGHADAEWQPLSCRVVGGGEGGISSAGAREG